MKKKIPKLADILTISHTLIFSCSTVICILNSSSFFWWSFNSLSCSSSRCCWAMTCCLTWSSSVAVLLWVLLRNVSLACNLNTERTFSTLLSGETAQQTPGVACWHWLSVTSVHFRGLRSAVARTGLIEPLNYRSYDNKEKAVLVRDIGLRPQCRE